MQLTTSKPGNRRVIHRLLDMAPLTENHALLEDIAKPLAEENNRKKPPQLPMNMKPNWKSRLKGLRVQLALAFHASQLPPQISACFI